MMTELWVCALLLVVSAGSVEVERLIPGRFIVTMDDTYDATSLRRHVESMEKRFDPDEMQILYVYDNLAGKSLTGYAAKLSARVAVQIRSAPGVKYIEPDKIFSIGSCISQTQAVWGLVRSNERGNYDSSAPQLYTYTPGGSGSGVDVYIVDTGIYCGNDDFTEKSKGTCTFGIDLVDGTNVDGNGHGTHCAGTVAGEVYGVAKEADLVAVRVLDDEGTGATSTIIAGIDWMVGNVAKTKKPSVANLSLGAGYSQAFDDATAAAVLSGVTMVVAAGNQNRNACDFSPSSTELAVTVGATDEEDSRADYSNFGVCLDIFAPGSNITSAWIGSPSATNTISGTSMAAPHVAGVAAKYLSNDSSMTPQEVAAKLVAEATKDVLSNVDGIHCCWNPPEYVSPNLMVFGTCSA